MIGHFFLIVLGTVLCAAFALALFIRADGFTIARADLIERYRTTDSRFLAAADTTLHDRERGEGSERRRGKNRA